VGEPESAFVLSGKFHQIQKKNLRKKDIQGKFSIKADFRG
jgi:hypothetical protein